MSEPTRRKTIIVDFDGVLHSYASGWKGADVIPDPPVENSLEWLAQVVEHFDVAIVSSRSHQPGGREAMREWVLKHGALFTRLDRAISDGRLTFPTEKPPAVMTIDDRARRFDGPGTLPSEEEIESFEPWFKREKLGVDALFKQATIDALTQKGWEWQLIALAWQNRRLRRQLGWSVIISVGAILFATLILASTL